jgi:putative hydrolase of the HAD superfamily
MPLVAVTLDAAGTLFDVAEPVGVTYARLAAEHGIALAPDEVDRRFRDALAAAPPLAFPGCNATRLAEHERAWWSAIVRQAFGPRGNDPAFEACFAALFAHYGRSEAWRMFPEVPDALARLRARGLRLAVVSNFDERLHSILGSLGLVPWLDTVVHSSRAGAAKPDPAIFRAVIAALDVRPDDALHVGDGAVEDVEGARAAGLHAVLVDRSGRRPPLPPGTRRVETLGELAVLVAAP